MAIQYKQLEAFTHGVLANIKFTSADTAQTAYATTAALLAALRSGDYHKDFVRDALLHRMSSVAQAICEIDKNPDRFYFREMVAPVVSGGLDGIVLQPSFGPYGAFVDAADGRPLTPRPLHKVKQIIAPATAAIYTSTEIAVFARSGQMCWFVCPSNQLRYERFFWTKPATTIFDGDTESVFPDYYEHLIVSGAVAEIAAKTDPSLAALHNGYYLQEMGVLKTGAPFKPSVHPAWPEP